MTTVPEELIILAGKGAYPRLLAESAREQGVKRLFAIAFQHETERSIAEYVDEVAWIKLAMLDDMLQALEASHIRQAVMVGQLTPTHLFRVRMDRRMLELLRKLSKRNAETIYGAVSDELAAIGITVLPAYLFMEKHIPDTPGVLSARTPTERERADIELGLEVANTTSGLDIGQTVVIKEGTILAVEAFEGTDATILRAGRLGGEGAVVVKVAKKGHDMRFDIPAIGPRTLRVLRKAQVSALAVQTGRAILLERERIIAEADRLGVTVVAV